MNHSALIYAALAPLVSNRCYPVVFAQSGASGWPAIRYTPVGGTAWPDACGTGDGAEDTVRVQIDCAALKFDDAMALATQVRAALAAVPSPPFISEGPPVCNFDADARVFLARQDFLIDPSSSA